MQFCLTLNVVDPPCFHFIVEAENDVATGSNMNWKQLEKTFFTVKTNKNTKVVRNLKG